MKKTNNSKLYRLLGVIVILIPLIFIFNQSSFINTLLSAALFFAIFFAVLRLIKLIFGKNKNQDIDKMPELTKEKEARLISV